MCSCEIAQTRTKWMQTQVLPHRVKPTCRGLIIIIIIVINPNELLKLRFGSVESKLNFK